MKSRKRRYPTIITTMLLLLMAACGNRGDNESGISPELVFENEYTKVVHVILEPGEQLALHEGNDRLVYALTDYTIQWEEDGEEMDERRWPSGSAHYHEAGLHSATNTGTETVEWLAFNRKDVELPSCPEQSLDSDVNLLDSEHASMKFENDFFRLTEVNLPAGEAIPMHDGINRVVYSLSDYTILYNSNVEGTSEKSFATGDIHWHGGCRHALENIGESAARFLVIAYK